MKEHFAPSDFIEDEFFCEWVIVSSKESQNFWEEYIKTNPERRKEIEKARLFIKSKVPEETDLSGEEIDSLWASIIISAK